MNGSLTLFYSEALSASDLNAIKVVEFLGLTIHAVRLDRERLSDKPADCCIASASTLCKIQAGQAELLRWLGRSHKMFLYGFRPTAEHNRLIQDLTGGQVLGVEGLRLENAAFWAETSARKMCRQFTGLTFGAANPAQDSVFIGASAQNSCSAWIRIGEKPCFVSVKHGGCDMTLSAAAEIADIDQSLPRHVTRLKYFSGLVPLMMFASATFPDAVWHTDQPRACFIVDDPLLKKRYGFLEYRKLFELMERTRFCTSLAFIPWNFRRSNREVARLFAAHPREYSLSVHGCDHTSGEFGTTDYSRLREKSRVALERMRQHARLSGVGFDDVMVFPQGIFSTVAVEAIKSCGYLAAVNSTPYPVDAADAITLRDRMQPAVTRFSNFPLFIRRHPEDLAELAFDLFLGKPALLVEHHGYFKKGYKFLAEVIDKLNALDERLEWSNLATICSQTSLIRTAGNGETHVKFFTDRFTLRNRANQAQKYILFRQAQKSPTIAINNRRAAYVQESDGFKIEVSLMPAEVAEVRIENQSSEPVPVPAKESRFYKAKVFVRRSLSEFRDNYVDRSRLLSKSVRVLLARTNGGY